jgi:DNA-binding NtrC family response regulator
MNHAATPGESQTAVTVQQSEGGGGTIVNVPASGVDLEAVERALIVFALQTTGGNRSRAADFLRLTRSALLYRIRKHRISIGHQV